MAVHFTNSKEETVLLGEQFAKALNETNLILFKGGLGVGKTAFCEGIAKGLLCKEPVSSPTFSIVNVYNGVKTFAHFDLYRIATREDLEITGFYDYLDSGAIVAAEWSENFSDLLKNEKAIIVEIKTISETQRQITINNGGLA